VNVAYHLYDHSGAYVVFDGRRTSLPFDLRPGDSVTLPVVIDLAADAVSAEISLVHEGVGWFHHFDSASVVGFLLP
jgi:hypothetical protein